MPTLNRFPLLGLWAEEAAHRLGYRRDEAEALGHAYAVLYAIRANKVAHHPKTTAEEQAATAPRQKIPTEKVRFGGDDLDVLVVDGRVRGQVGGEKPQTPATYRASVAAKFPPGYYERLQQAFRDFFKTMPPRVLRERQVYNLYDQWKKACGVGRLVDLDRLLTWCQQRNQATNEKEKS